jgi:hypothetical protein
MEMLYHHCISTSFSYAIKKGQETQKELELNETFQLLVCAIVVNLLGINVTNQPTNQPTNQTD